MGAGNRLIPGAINVDRTRHREEINCVCDLNVLPWPWDAETFDKVAAIAVLEHLEPTLLTLMDEVWRVLKPGGIAVVKLPAWDHEVSWNDLSHRHHVGAEAMDQVDPRTDRGRRYTFYTRRKWAIQKRKRGTTSYWWTLKKMGLDWEGRE